MTASLVDRLNQYAATSYLSKQLRATLIEAAEALARQGEDRKPDGYAYRYSDGYIRHSGGREINGGKPIEAIPYFYASPSSPIDPAAVLALAEALEERERKDKDDCVDESGAFKSEEHRAAWNFADGLGTAASQLRALTTGGE